MTSKKGNEISKNASEDDPAVVISRSPVSFYPSENTLPRLSVYSEYSGLCNFG